MSETQETAAAQKAAQVAQEVERRYTRAREMVKRGRQALAEGHRMMRQLRADIVHARTRGQINQQIWECERMAGGRNQFFSQAGQDAYLDERVFKGKEGGTFVEVGGYDGITGSNCLFFELMRGWNGLLIEPSPLYHGKAARFRRCTCLRLAVAESAGEAEFLEIQEGMKQMSGLVSSYDQGLLARVQADPRHQAKKIQVKTRPLAQILDSHHLREIDFVSLDVEGAEKAILASFPFERYKITAWTVENNAGDREIPQIMQEKGYRRVEAFGMDDIYVRQDR